LLVKKKKYVMGCASVNTEASVKQENFSRNIPNIWFHFGINGTVLQVKQALQLECKN